jgi:hypothetical protein
MSTNKYWFEFKKTFIDRTRFVWEAQILPFHMLQRYKKIKQDTMCGLVSGAVHLVAVEATGSIDIHIKKDN